MATAYACAVFPYIHVEFYGMPRDPSLEAAIHRWVARLESMSVRVQRAEVAIEPVGRRRTSVQVYIGALDGVAPQATTAHADAYVAVSDAFREVRRQLLSRATAPRKASLALTA
jgi:ribosome-associated translation inhibitor RaiA